MKVAVHVAVYILFLPFIVNGQQFVNFEAAVQRFVRKKAAHLGHKVEWWDMHGNHPELQKNADYKNHLVSARVCNFKYGNSVNIVQRPCSRDLRHINNINMTSAVVMLMQGTRELINYYTWNISQGVRMDAPITVKINVPAMEPEIALPQWTINLQKSFTKVVVGRHKFIFEERPINIQPRTYIKSEFNFLIKESTVPWEADVELEGTIAVWYTEPYNGHHLWFYSVVEMADKNFRAMGHCRLVYRAGGMFTAIQQMNATIQVAEYDLPPLGKSQPDPDQRPRNVTVFSPNKLTLYGVKGLSMAYQEDK